MTNNKNQVIQHVLGFDYGLTNIGVATGNRKLKTSSPLCVVRAKNGEPIWKELDVLFKCWQPDGVVIGLPLNEDGSEGALADRVQAFAQAVNKRFQLPYFFCNERYTTKAARTIAQDYWVQTKQTLLKTTKSSRQHCDAIAASLVVQQWLDRCEHL